DALFDGVGTLYLDEHRFATDAAWIAAPLPETIAVLAAQLARAPSPQSFFLCAIDPLPARSPTVPSAFAPHGALLVNSLAAWDEASGDASNVAWHAETMAAIAPLTAGRYVGEADVAAHPDHARHAFSSDSWQRLERLRRTYDPDGILHGWFG